ncbi:flagellar type III secretion system pore protein FliP [Chromobacterium subtsugae]|uniref:Flagellar biosynthetic protein FliP n=1 Tax=Chromobacterium subtsugae TaxID=251747 RepID=A0ABS7FBM3_9NEIS|nr:MULTISPECIES: flagellar type III secretion system pore protein FliP [Chromobacterium]KUM03341.1 flagellar biosynthesis protein flip [Chromobacterium subtsugae]KZE85937.1 flagellar biosynthesis protein flip [Chromobacterium sp. F49]MBW7567309.1 flagellar type III secretion system pore protein FliP [Chromobacterium subtsugae]MBW8287475.1 flagellar type III secretion system pore protein FliP [Chromobacterium subtsugae]OBU85167.1 flagellar biosynthesis protein flip [Chromobacterium subtsugae]
MKRYKLYAPLLAGLLLASPCGWADSLKLLTATSGGAAVDFTVKTQILILMTALGLLPVLALMMTSFTRFVIVLSLLRQALGLQQGLPNRLITGVALILTLLVMRPVGLQVWNEAMVPFDQDKITMPQALEIASKPVSRFMLAQTSKTALSQVARLSGEGDVARPEDHAFTVKLAAFVLSELKTAFQIGCMLFIPFLVIDLVVSSVLMAMGMMMLSPLVISLPLKLLLFVLVDGWSLTVNTLVTSIQAY